MMDGIVLRQKWRPKMANKTKSRPAKIILLTAIGLLTAGSIVYLYLLNKKETPEKTEPQKLNQAA